MFYTSDVIVENKIIASFTASDFTKAEQEAKRYIKENEIENAYVLTDES